MGPREGQPVSGDSAARATDLVRRAAKLEAYAQRVRIRAHELLVEADDLRRLVRPILPTLDQLEGIPIAVEHIHAGRESESHLGDPCAPGPNPYAVTWADTSDAGRIGVRHLSPLGSATNGGRLWRFTDAEVESILATVRGSGGVILDHWTHDEGLSVRISREPGIPGA